jgi:2-polyprenyl-6-methoxyphenol hydroxylase-like FAD-dependent oxidoreductase
VVWSGRIAELRERTPDVPYPNLMLVPQWRTEEILRARLAELGGHVEQAELASFAQDEHGVTAVLDRSVVVRADYLVGADGGRSRVRKRLGVDFIGATDQTDRLLLGDVRAQGLDGVHWINWSDPMTNAVIAGMCPLPGTGLYQFFAPVRAGEDPEPTLETFQRILADVTDVRLTGITWASLYRVNRRLAERFRVGRVFLVGDAAHVHTPAGGQGLNTSVQDAYNLGWKLASGSALDTYEQERQPIAAAVLDLTGRLHRRGYRAASFSLSQDTTQLGLGYPDSPLSLGGGMAGQRAPDAPLRDGRLFDIFRGPHFTLLAFDPGHAETVARVNKRFGAAVRAHLIGDTGDLVDSHGHARHAYGTNGLVLVRPDGYIGVYDDDPEHYLALLPGLQSPLT